MGLPSLPPASPSSPYIPAPPAPGRPGPTLSSPVTMRTTLHSQGLRSLHLPVSPVARGGGPAWHPLPCSVGLRNPAGCSQGDATFLGQHAPWRPLQSGASGGACQGGLPLSQRAPSVPTPTGSSVMPQGTEATGHACFLEQKPSCWQLSHSRPDMGLGADSIGGYKGERGAGTATSGAGRALCAGAAQGRADSSLRALDSGEGPSRRAWALQGQPWPYEPRRSQHTPGRASRPDPGGLSGICDLTRLGVGSHRLQDGFHSAL